MVTVCGSGAEAMKALNGGDFDVMITDQVMPEMTGLELAGQVREICTEIRVMLYSGLTAAESVEVKGAMDAGVIQGFLAKPFNGGELAGRVREVLDGQVR